MLIEQLIRQGNMLFRHRGIIPIFILIIGLLVFYNNSEVSSFHILKILLGLAACFLGLFIRVIIVGYSPKQTSGRNTEEQVAAAVNMTGLYSIWRHPLYIGNFCIWMGVCVWVGNSLFTIAITLCYLIYYGLIILAEEDFLLRKFGMTYVQWARNTPILVPALRLLKQPKGSFSWKKVVRQEKNGFTAIFIVLFFFECLHNFKHRDHIIDYQSIIFHAMVISVILYFVLKFLKYNTNIITPTSG